MQYIHITDLSKPTTIYEACRGFCYTGGPKNPYTTNEIDGARELRRQIIPPLKDLFNNNPKALPKSNSRVIMCFVDEVRHRYAIQTVLETYESILLQNNIHNVELIAVCTDLVYSQQWTYIPKDRSFNKVGNFDIVYLNYSDKVGLYHKLGLLKVNQQPWRPDFTQIMYLPGHLMNLGDRMPVLEKLMEVYGKDNVFYTLNLPEPDNDHSWQIYRPWVPGNMSMGTKWKDYLYSFERRHPAETESEFPNMHHMSGMGMPPEYYNDILCHYISDVNKNVLTEKEARCMINRRPMVLTRTDNYDSLDYEFNYVQNTLEDPDLQSLLDCVDNMKCNPVTQQEILDHNFNTLLSRAEKTHKYLNEVFNNDLDELITRGGMFNHAY